MPDGSLIAIRMRLLGGKQVAAEANTAATAIGKTGVAAEGASKKSASASARLAKTATSLKSIGKGLTKYITLPALGVAVASGKMALDFDKSMRNVNSLLKLPERGFERLKGQVLGISEVTGKAPNDLAEGLYQIASTGYNGAQGLEILAKSARAATAGLSTTETAVDAGTTVLKAYGLKAGEIGKVQDTLFEAVDKGKIEYDELASQLGYVVSTADAAGVSFKETAGEVAQLTLKGQLNGQAVTNLNQAITSFLKPSKDMKKAVHELGYENAESLLKTKGFQGSIEALYETAGGSKEKMAAYFGNVRALRAVLALTGEGAKEADANLKNFNHTSGAAARALKQQEQSFSFKLQKAWAKLQVVLIELGEKILPIVVPFLVELGEGVKSAVEWFDKLPDPVKKVALETAAVAALAGPMLLFASAILTAAKNIGILNTTAGGGIFSGKGLLRAGRIGAGVLGPLAAQSAGSAIGGDVGNWVSKAGTGASLGFALGGPAGALAGGAIGGGIAAYEKLFAAQKRVSITTIKLARDGKEIAIGMHRQRTAGDALTASTKRLFGAQNNRNLSNRRIKRSQHQVAEAIRESGRGSDATRAAERRLTNAIDAHREASRRLHKAEKYRGVQLSEFKTIARTNVLNERNEINNLKTKATRLNNEYIALKKSNASQGELSTKATEASRANHKLNESVKTMAETISEAGTKAGPKFATFLKNAEREALEFGSALQAVEEKMSNLGSGLPGVGEFSGPNPVLSPKPHKKGSPAHLMPRRRPALPAPRAAGVTQRLESGARSRPVHAQINIDRKTLIDTVVEGVEDAEARR